MGDFILWVFFEYPVSGEALFAFGNWLVQDKPETIDLEVFPKQSHLQLDNGKRKFGNQLRLPGKHHKREHWSRIYDGSGWVEGNAAAEIILQAPLSSPDQIPQEAIEFTPPRPEKPQRQCNGRSEVGDDWQEEYDGDLRTLDIEALCEDRLTGGGTSGWLEVYCPWCDEHTTDEFAYIFPAEVGEFPTFKCHHAHCSGRSLPDLLATYSKNVVNNHCREVFNQSADLRRLEDRLMPFDDEVHRDEDYDEIFDIRTHLSNEHRNF